jgi:hypothetical protein
MLAGDPGDSDIRLHHRPAGGEPALTIRAQLGLPIPATLWHRPDKSRRQVRPLFRGGSDGGGHAAEIG